MHNMLPIAHSCSLKAALAAFEKEVEETDNLYSRRLFCEFVMKLEEYGYSYPNGDFNLWVKDKPTMAKDLTDLVIGLLLEVRQRRSLSR